MVINTQVYAAYKAFLATLTKPQRAAILDVLKYCVVNVFDDCNVGEELFVEFLFIVNLTAATSVIITTNDG